MKINIDEIGVKIKIIDEKKLKAIIGLDFGDFIVKGFRIMDSDFENDLGRKLWLTPPSYLGGGRHHPIFYMPNKPLWKLLEKRIYEQYDIALTEHYKKRLGVKEEEIV